MQDKTSATVVGYQIRSLEGARLHDYSGGASLQLKQLEGIVGERATRTARAEGTVCAYNGQLPFPQKVIKNMIDEGWRAMLDDDPAGPQYGQKRFCEWLPSELRDTLDQAEAECEGKKTELDNAAEPRRLRVGEEEARTLSAETTAYVAELALKLHDAHDFTHAWQQPLACQYGVLL